jgi:hypothetical protein
VQRHRGGVACWGWDGLNSRPQAHSARVPGLSRVLALDDFFSVRLTTTLLK